jgi:lysophospholipase L1-like esterase
MALVALVALTAACGRSPSHTALPAGTRVLVLGDSLAAGYGLSPEQAWPALLEKETGWSVENAGVSGNTTAQGLERLESRLAAGDLPAAVFVLLGGNDMLRRVPEAETRANLTETIRQIREAGATPILIAVPRPSLAGAMLQGLDDAAFYAELAEANRVALIEAVIADVLSDPALKLDRLHPNADGQQEVVRRFVEVLREIGLLSG